MLMSVMGCFLFYGGLVSQSRSISGNPVRCTLWCRVIDNFGDAGVAWRLAKSLSQEFHWRVRLMIDRP
ncbi:elongation factor P maturation arginine rhamnosyltransferase EarP, partial [Duodenibacillus massiliensis]|uniref:elongation factor P maturation arginine rhamnosyltransferase EarP n=1 Tax=Duodenibacillus massiliensis TaxID=1852381 RepID=UPI003F7F1881